MSDTTNWERREAHFETMIDNAIRTAMIEQATQLAVWKDSTQVVGTMEVPLDDYINSITEGDLTCRLRSRKLSYIGEALNIAKGRFDNWETEE